MGQLVGERWRETEKKGERERRGSETDVPKLYPTMNMNSVWVLSQISLKIDRIITQPEDK